MTIVGCVTSGKGDKTPEQAFSDALRNSQCDVARSLVESGIDCNENANAFYYLFSKKDLTFEQKIQMAKKISNGMLTSPYILVYVEPENYKDAIDALGMNIKTKIIDRDVLGRAVDSGSCSKTEVFKQLSCLKILTKLNNESTIGG
jgi:hypothetical protein